MQIDCNCIRADGFAVLPFSLRGIMDKCTPESLLSGRNIKVTRQRQVVLRAIIDSGRPFCANDLHSAIAVEMDIATIYRNLELLNSEGIIRQVMNEKERQYYELACEHNPEHPHFYCNSCGKIYCMKQKQYKLQNVKNSAGKNFIVEQTLLQYRGLCPACC